MGKFVSMERASVTSQSVPPRNGGELASCFNTPGEALTPGGPSVGQLLKPVATPPRLPYMTPAQTRSLSCCAVLILRQKSLTGIPGNSPAAKYSASLSPELLHTTPI